MCALLFCHTHHFLPFQSESTMVTIYTKSKTLHFASTMYLCVFL
jgi:hypothetical protein